MTGFSPRKQNLALYIMPGFASYEKLLSRLEKHKTAKSCLYINKLADVDTGILEKIISASVNDMQRLYTVRKLPRRCLTFTIHPGLFEPAVVNPVSSFQY